MTDRPSAIVIGAGHNGLVCSAYLAKAGYAVRVLEARDSVGGALAEREFGDGFKAPGLAHYHYPIHPTIQRDLRIEADRTDVHPRPETIALDLRGRHLTLGMTSLTGDEISQADEQAFAKFKKNYLAFAKALSPLMLNKPPRLKDMDGKDQRTLAQLGWAMRFGLGAASMQEFLRVGGINIYDVLNELFESEGLKGAVAVDAVMGHHMGPRTPTTVLTYLQRLFGETTGAPVPARANGCVASALENAARKAGADIQNNATVSEIIIVDQQATGIRLDNGDVLDADIIMSGADAKSTFLNLVGAEHLDAMFAKRIGATRTNGNVAKLHLGLTAPPNFSNVSSDQLSNRFLIAPDMRYIEHAFNCAKYGRCSGNPVLEIVMPTALDPSLAPDGMHVMSVNASFAPYNLRGGWDHAREQFAQTIIDAIEPYAPGVKNSICCKEFLAPPDIEREYGTSGGHWHHGELTIDQSFMMRPVHGCAQYDTPIDGLFLCGAAAHPGGGITGLPGRNAAQRILALSKRRPR